jgi:hypothetical protein
MSQKKRFDRSSVWALLVVAVILLAANLLLQLGSSTPVLATATDLPPQLEKKADGVYYLAWTNSDTVYVNCYPGVRPRFIFSPAKHNSGRYALTCGTNPVKPYKA